MNRFHDKSAIYMETTGVYENLRPRYPELSGKVVLVTGSSMGIGRGIALRLAREGMRVVIQGKTQAEVDITVRELQLLGASAQGMSVDFGASDAVDQLFGWIRGRYERLDLLVNNAADLARTSFSEATVGLLDSQLQVNVRAPYLCCLRAAPIMLQQGSGVIVNISSVGGDRAHWMGLPYDMTKGALNSMTRAMALELACNGIRVNAIAPGAIRGWRTPPPDHVKVQAISARIPLGRMGTDLEVAAVVAFLASDEATYITGQVISVDGGITAQLSPPGQPI